MVCMSALYVSWYVVWHMWGHIIDMVYNDNGNYCRIFCRRYIKIIEVEPINFLLRSAREQRNIIYSYMSYLKISPVRMQIKVISKKADISSHLDKIQEEIKREQDERCKILLMDYYNLIRRIGLKEAVTDTVAITL